MAAAAAAAGWCPGIMGYLPAECGGILMDIGLIPEEAIPIGGPAAEDIILR